MSNFIPEIVLRYISRIYVKIYMKFNINLKSLDDWMGIFVVLMIIFAFTLLVVHIFTRHW